MHYISSLLLCIVYTSLLLTSDICSLPTSIAASASCSNHAAASRQAKTIGGVKQMYLTIIVIPS